MSTEVMNKKELSFVVSSSPHIRDNDSIAKIMWDVNLALLPAACYSFWYFGMNAFVNMLICVVVAMATEYVIQKWRGKPVTISDGSALLTGMLLAMNVTPLLPGYMAAVGAFVAIAIAKHTMGGLGYNIFNPALIGRAFLMASWPVAMTTWSKLDAVTTATPLAIWKLQGYDALLKTFGIADTTWPFEMYKTLFWGARNGSSGETTILFLLLGGIYLIWRGRINWQVPVTMIATVAILTWCFGGEKLFSGDPVLAVLSGGLVLGAFFMATDMVTIPITIKGRIIFAIGAGVITTLIRLKGGYPEGVCYSILLMNCVTPLIDRWIKPKKYGTQRREENVA